MVIIAGNGGGTAEDVQEILELVEESKVKEPVATISTYGLNLSDIYMKEGKKILKVLEKEYDISALNKDEILFLWITKNMYLTHSTMRYDMSFELFVYKIYTESIFARSFERFDLIEATFEAVEVEPESISFWLDDLMYEIKSKLKFLGLTAGVITFIGIALGIGVVGLIVYQYSQSFIAEKGAIKARKK